MLISVCRPGIHVKETTFLYNNRQADMLVIHDGNSAALMTSMRWTLVTEKRMRAAFTEKFIAMEPDMISVYAGVTITSFLKAKAMLRDRIYERAISVTPKGESGANDALVVDVHEIARSDYAKLNDLSSGVVFHKGELKGINTDGHYYTTEDTADWLGRDEHNALSNADSRVSNMLDDDNGRRINGVLVLPGVVIVSERCDDGERLVPLRNDYEVEKYAASIIPKNTTPETDSNTRRSTKSKTGVRNTGSILFKDTAITASLKFTYRKSTSDMAVVFDAKRALLVSTVASSPLAETRMREAFLRFLVIPYNGEISIVTSVSVDSFNRFVLDRAKAKGDRLVRVTNTYSTFNRAAHDICSYTVLRSEYAKIHNLKSGVIVDGSELPYCDTDSWIYADRDVGEWMHAEAYSKFEDANLEIINLLEYSANSDKRIREVLHTGEGVVICSVLDGVQKLILLEDDGDIATYGKNVYPEYQRAEIPVPKIKLPFRPYRSIGINLTCHDIDGNGYFDVMCTMSIDDFRGRFPIELVEDEMDINIHSDDVLTAILPVIDFRSAQRVVDELEEFGFNIVTVTYDERGELVFSK